VVITDKKLDPGVLVYSDVHDTLLTVPTHTGAPFSVQFVFYGSKEHHKRLTLHSLGLYKNDKEICNFIDSSESQDFIAHSIWLVRFQIPQNCYPKLDENAIVILKAKMTMESYGEKYDVDFQEEYIFLVKTGWGLMPLMAYLFYV